MSDVAILWHCCPIVALQSASVAPPPCLWSQRPHNLQAHSMPSAAPLALRLAPLLLMALVGSKRNNFSTRSRVKRAAVCPAVVSVLSVIALRSEVRSTSLSFAAWATSATPSPTPPHSALLPACITHEINDVFALSTCRGSRVLSFSCSFSPRNWSRMFLKSLSAAPPLISWQYPPYWLNSCRTRNAAASSNLKPSFSAHFNVISASSLAL
eukprot:CAMPEP_0175834690 /NCGR_PEP_ID=MMETSP0107_2-20121207/16191_1 /TAXON_ID=195067 ORGANISM="Goniomonas pacifica, Strain CCMP1869" /NCGR_SAMPLE_ID=MMETSP0107_2 /ASSEMBLY_ACC=CAM_ASM_000203 /LENGTH=210 /DNA_ID=CAMNT_0017147929 /DNA_START=260 /DNA_END=893 /DNA_ORIENTATION=+